MALLMRWWFPALGDGSPAHKAPDRLAIHDYEGVAGPYSPRPAPASSPTLGLHPASPSAQAGLSKIREADPAPASATACYAVP